MKLLGTFLNAAGKTWINRFCKIFTTFVIKAKRDINQDNTQQ